MTSKSKTLAIVGSEATMVTGYLVYTLGGIGLRLIEKLERHGVKSYDKAAQFLRDADEELFFCTPHYRITVQDQVSSSDGLLLVVAPPSLASETFFDSNTIQQLKDSALLLAQQKAIALVKIPESHEQSESVYSNMTQNLRQALQNIGISAESIICVPNDLRGQNVIEPSPKTPWYTEPTLLAALDDIFS